MFKVPTVGTCALVNGPCAAVTVPQGSEIVAEALRREVARLHQTEANGSVNAARHEEEARGCGEEGTAGEASG